MRAPREWQSTLALKGHGEYSLWSRAGPSCALRRTAGVSGSRIGDWRVAKPLRSRQWRWYCEAHILSYCALSPSEAVLSLAAGGGIVDDRKGVAIQTSVSPMVVEC